MHELVSRNKLCEHIDYILLCINFLNYNPLLSMDGVVSDVNMISPFMMDLILG